MHCGRIRTCGVIGSTSDFESGGLGSSPGGSTMKTLIFLALLCVVPINEGTVIQQKVDLIEVNHFYDENGKKVFSQILFYEWNRFESRHDVLAWRLLRKMNYRKPVRTRKGDYKIVWDDNGQLREVECLVFRESWTQYDPELIERNYLPKEQRKGLVGRKTSRWPTTGSIPAPKKLFES